MRQHYSKVDMDVLTPSRDHEDHAPVLLTEIFVAQQVKSDPPPVELPREVTLRLRETDVPDSRPLPEGVSQADLDRVRQYEQRAPVDILPLVASGEHHLVLLGDPGSGKSTLARYLVRALAEPDLTGPLASLKGWLPLLIELREYAQHGSGPAVRDFLDFLEHQHQQQGLGLPRGAIETYLEKDGRALVVFDGLDEIFDAALRDRVARQVSTFAERYPHARMVVTSRPVGYQRSALEAGGFRRYKLQDLDISRIREFVGRWYAIARLDNPTEADRLKRRLIEAIEGSAPVAELAGNPMLLTILAIIGRRRSLPRDRASVYKHAVNVLVEQWDPRRFLANMAEGITYLHPADRLEMLRLIARRLQDSPAGLSGNFITSEDLMAEFANFLQMRDPTNISRGQAGAAAERMVRQFHDRSFILSRFGGEVYGFVHRSFLEYLTAADIVHRFNKEHLLSDEELIDGYFGRRCRDQSWHEVLQLTTGMLDERFANRAVLRMLDADPHWAASDDVEPHHILVAIRCIGEVRKITLLAEACTAAVEQVIRMLAIAHRRMTRTFSDSLNRAIGQSVLPVFATFAPYWPGRERYLTWFLRNGFVEADDPATCLTATRVAVTLCGDDPALREFLLIQARRGWSVHHRAAAGTALAQRWAGDPRGQAVVRAQCGTDPSWEVRHSALRAVVSVLPGDANTLDLLRERVVVEEHGDIRRTAVRALAAHWHADPETLPLLKELADRDRHEEVRLAALEAIGAWWREDAATADLLRSKATTDSHESVRRGVLLAIASAWPDKASSSQLLKNRATVDPSTDVRRAAVTAVATCCSGKSSLEWLRTRAASDGEPSVRQAAVLAIGDGWPESTEALSSLVDRLGDRSPEVRHAAVQTIGAGRFGTSEAATSLRRVGEFDVSPDVRQAALEAVATHLRHDEEVRQWLRERAECDPQAYVRSTAVRLVADEWNGDPPIEMWLHETASRNASSLVRRSAVQAIATAGRDDPDTLPVLLRRGVNDQDIDVRLTAMRYVADSWADDARTQPWLRERCVEDPSEDVRNLAMRTLVARWHDDPETLPLLRERAQADQHEYIRRAAVWMVADGWPDAPGSLPLLRERAAGDRHEIVRRAATQAIAVGWHDDPQTLPLLLGQARNDEHEHVRAGAVRAIASGWHDAPETFAMLLQRVTVDTHQAVRLLVLQIIVSGWAALPQTRQAVERVVSEDTAPAVRLTAVQALRRHWLANPATGRLLQRLAADDTDAEVRHAAGSDRGGELLLDS
ncbi:HEAT repeat domain-containing protein [Phytohabitans suffuscus]|uniref:HEAT repeat domain-containing protein n=1 Tax=Phytohabitans suffuscus TaxID=624315 RepID=UPI0015637FB2|nr:HEAT repeat domain-containing protein [Phytohabitans suffuscus]